MKRISISFMVVSIMAFAISASAQDYVTSAANTLEITSEAWLRWTINSDQDINRFSVDRLWMGGKFRLSTRTDGLFRINVYQDFKPQTIYDDLGNPIGTTTRYFDGWAIRVEDAYLTYHFHRFLRVTGGVQPVHFGTLDTWEYLTIAADLERTVKLKDPDEPFKMNSMLDRADLGLVFSGGRIDSGLFNYQIGIYQGTGYVNPENNEDKDLLVSVGSHPFGDMKILQGLGIRLSYYLGANGQDAYDKLRSAGLINYDSQYLNLQAKILSATDDKIDSIGYTAFGALKLGMLHQSLSPFQLVLRADHWDANDDLADDAYDFYVLGINWYIETVEGSTLMVQANLENTTFEDEDKDDVNTFKLQLRWKY